MTSLTPIKPAESNECSISYRLTVVPTEALQSYMKLTLEQSYYVGMKFRKVTEKRYLTLWHKDGRNFQIY